MKKLIILLLLLIPSIVLANPMLVTDLPEQPVTTCEIEVDGTVQPGLCIISGTNFEWLDLAGFANGQHTFKARWQDASGWWSEWSDPFVVIKPRKPGNIRIK